MRGLRWVRSGKTLLDVPSLDLEGPGLVLVTGASGSGKSSLLKALTGTLEDFQGGHAKGAVEPSALSKPTAVGFAPQDAQDAFLAHSPLTEFQLRLQALGWRHDAACREALRLLAEIGLEERAPLAIHKLSAGERRRLALFAARIHRPSILLLDEPLNHLDAEWRTTILNDVCAFAEHALLLIATHEPGPWSPIATRRLHVEAGRVADAPVAASEKRPAPPPAIPSDERPRLVAAGITHRRGLFAPVSLSLPNGLHAIAGPNGSGKSTLLRILGGLDAPETGQVRFDEVAVHGRSTSELARFRAHHIEEPRDTFFMEHASDEVRFQPTNAGIEEEEVDARLRHVTTEFRLDGLIGRHPLALSGGEQERLALACTAATHASLILLDEPTNGLDAAGRTDLLRFLETFARTACVILATHDEDLLARCATVHRFLERKLVPVRTPNGPFLVEVSARAP